MGKGGVEIPIDSFPAHIDIHYLSYVEDKMYHIDAKLSIEKSISYITPDG